MDNLKYLIKSCHNKDDTLVIYNEIYRNNDL